MYNLDAPGPSHHLPDGSPALNGIHVNGSAHHAHATHGPLAGKKGLVVGLANAHSIAYGCAQQARAQGADLVLSCLNDKARSFVQPHADALQAPLLNCNVEQPGDLQTLVEQAVAHHGHLDFVVHSIAWAPLEELHGSVTDSTGAGFARAMQVSCHSLAELARLCAPHMRAGGSIITMSYQGASQAIGHYGLMGPVKAALESLVRYLAVELGPKGIRVHAVSPGPIPTRAASGIAEFDSLMEQAQAKSPLQRLVTLEEIGALTAFLCSAGASGMTGQTIFVDAGCHAVA
ncbi:enoyl-ACP reductase FabI [Rhodoferax aquaticus]|uniref:Enoyl-[acyl-carrier-protein] reductase [NADH] n=1 Tax=Rhodoferax aquaticus TaxID=2527691 RepID=A0A515EKK7_9BURK|nr:enoyl-ACP reductase FabI [Rhodoferax aquaticus]QDL53188.1 enoyl-[acyl-carrier-protein] reductase FabI [Rhodoferax aquaticus]